MGMTTLYLAKSMNTQNVWNKGVPLYCIMYATLGCIQNSNYSDKSSLHNFKESSCISTFLWLLLLIATSFCCLAELFVMKKL